MLARQVDVLVAKEDRMYESFGDGLLGVLLQVGKEAEYRAETFTLPMR